ncbi:MAG: DUF2934 domain-containing protein [Alphaproteobacteria bacterium]
MERIRQWAYQLWEAEGGEHGRDQEYWYRAVAKVTGSQGGTDDDSGAPG